MGLAFLLTVTPITTLLSKERDCFTLKPSLSV
jgi:hypothetical protein